MAHRGSRESKRATVNTFVPSWSPAVLAPTIASGGITLSTTNLIQRPILTFPSHSRGGGMQIRLAHTTDAAAVNELLDQLGYPQDGTATTATRIQTWGDDPAGA